MLLADEGRTADPPARGPDAVLRRALREMTNQVNRLYARGDVPSVLQQAEEVDLHWAPRLDGRQTAAPGDPGFTVTFRGHHWTLHSHGSTSVHPDYGAIRRFLVPPSLSDYQRHRLVREAPTPEVNVFLSIASYLMGDACCAAPGRRWATVAASPVPASAFAMTTEAQLWTSTLAPATSWVRSPGGIWRAARRRDSVLALEAVMVAAMFPLRSRNDSPQLAHGLSNAQWTSIMLLVVAIAGCNVARRREQLRPGLRAVEHRRRLTLHQVGGSGQPGGPLGAPIAGQHRDRNRRAGVGALERPPGSRRDARVKQGDADAAPERR